MQTLERITIPVLKNGSLLKGPRCDDHFTVVRETCAFDSLTKILASAIVTNPTYVDTIITINNIYNFARTILSINTKNITTKIYQERTRILSIIPIFETKPYMIETMLCI